MSVVAARLGCSVSNVYRLIGRGDLACLSLGASKGYRVPESAVEAFVRERSWPLSRGDAAEHKWPRYG